VVLSTCSPVPSSRGLIWQQGRSPEPLWRVSRSFCWRSSGSTVLPNDFIGWSCLPPNSTMDRWMPRADGAIAIGLPAERPWWPLPLLGRHRRNPCSLVGNLQCSYRKRELRRKSCCRHSGLGSLPGPEQRNQRLQLANWNSSIPRRRRNWSRLSIRAPNHALRQTAAAILFPRDITALSAAAAAELY